MRSFSLRPFASASARCRSGHRTREWESHDTQHPQFSYYDPSQSSLKHYPSIQPGPVPPSLDIPPEPNITGSLLVKPAEFLSEAAHFCTRVLGPFYLRVSKICSENLGSLAIGRTFGPQSRYFEPLQRFSVRPNPAYMRSIVDA